MARDLRRQAAEGVPRSHVHGALLLTQLCWGSAGVVNKLGLSGAGVLPLFFAFLREATAAPLLFALLCASRRGGQNNREPPDCFGPCGVEGGREAHGGGAGVGERMRLTDGEASRASSLGLRLLPGLFIFVDQFCGLVGISLADPLSAAAWQPSQVVFTVMVCSCLGMEVLTPQKVAGALLTVAGALCLVFLSGNTSSSGSGRGDPRIGQLFFFFNCLASSLEVVVWRRLLRHAEGPMAHFAVMAESYLVAAFLMALACTASSFSPAAVNFFCPECRGNAWHLPPQALWAVAYSVVFQTILGYIAQAWALRHAESSLASLYATAQPLTAAAVTVTLLTFGFNPKGALSWPGREMIGAVLIIAGLLVAEVGFGASVGNTTADIGNNLDCSRTAAATAAA